MHRADWREQGEEPDYRFSLANERTFLAWIRTALAVAAGAVLLHQADMGSHRGWPLPALSVALAGLAGTFAGLAYFRWKSYEIAMRKRLALPVGFGLGLTSAAVAGLAAVLVLILKQG